MSAIDARRLAMGAVLLLLAAGAGCAARWTAARGSVGSGLVSKVHYLSLELAGGEIVRVDGLTSQWMEAGRLAVSARIRNRSEDPIALSVRAVFIDRAGNSLPAADDWRLLRIEPQQSIPFEAAAPNALAADYRIEVRRAANY